MTAWIPDSPDTGAWLTKVVRAIPSARLDYLPWIVHDVFLHYALAGDVDGAIDLWSLLHDGRMKLPGRFHGDSSVSALVFASGRDDVSRGEPPHKGCRPGMPIQERVEIAEAWTWSDVTGDRWGVPVASGPATELAGLGLFRAILERLRESPTFAITARRDDPLSLLVRLLDERRAGRFPLAQVDVADALMLLAVLLVSFGDRSAAADRLRQLIRETFDKLGYWAERVLTFRCLVPLLLEGVLAPEMGFPAELRNRLRQEFRAAVDARLSSPLPHAPAVRSSVRVLLGRLATRLDGFGAPLRSGLRPGRSLAELRAAVAADGIVLHADVVDFFRWQDGAVDAAAWIGVEPDDRVLGLQEALEVRRGLIAVAIDVGLDHVLVRPESWLPITGNDSGDYLAVVCDPAHPRHGAVFRHTNEWDDRWEYPSLRHYLAMLAEAYRRGAYRRVDDGSIESDDERLLRIQAKYRLDVG